MSFFSFLGKTVGKIAKAGLGVVTGGVSTQVIDTVGGLIQKKKQAVNQQNLYEMAGLTDKTSYPARRTEYVQPGGGSGIIAAYGGSNPVNVRTGSRPRKRKAPARAAARRAPARAARAPRARRAPPKGGLDFRAMSAAWKAAGQPSSWQDWIATNPIRSG